MPLAVGSVPARFVPAAPWSAGGPNPLHPPEQVGFRLRRELFLPLWARGSEQEERPSCGHRYGPLCYPHLDFGDPHLLLPGEASPWSWQHFIGGGH